MKKKFLIFCFVSASSSFAALMPEAIIKGQIVSFDEKKVTIYDERSSSNMVVLREDIPRHFQIKPGNRIFAFVKTRPFLDKLRKQRKNGKKRRKASKK